MVGVEKVQRPFGQREYRLEFSRPTLAGDHYKFTILLPVTEKVEGQRGSKEIFTDSDIRDLKRLFRQDLGGATYFELKGPPPIQGDWVDKRGDVVIDWHVRMEIYTKKHKVAITYFEELKARLLKLAKEIRQAEQEEIVIERTSVSFVPHTPLEALLTKQREKLKDLKR